jgi:hypothetical protein
VEHPAKGLEAKTSFADVLVPIDAAAAGTLRIVGVHDAQAIEAHEGVELVERASVAVAARDVVPRSHEVAGVETHADATRAVEVADDGCQMLEAVPQ